MKKGSNRSRFLGIWKGKVEMSEDFDELPNSFIELMRNSPLVGVELDIDRKIDKEREINFKTLREKLLSCPDTRKEYEGLALEYDPWERLDKLAKEMNLGKFDWEEFKKYRDEGKK